MSCELSHIGEYNIPSRSIWTVPSLSTVSNFQISKQFSEWTRSLPILPFYYVYNCISKIPQNPPICTLKGFVALDRARGSLNRNGEEILARRGVPPASVMVFIVRITLGCSFGTLRLSVNGLVLIVKVCIE